MYKLLFASYMIQNSVQNIFWEVWVSAFFFRETEKLIVSKAYK